MQMLYLRVMDSLRNLRDGEEGQGLVEYALILGLVAVVATVVLTEIGGDITNVFNEIKAKFE